MASVPTILQAAGITRVTLKSTSTCIVGDLIGFDGTDWVLADADARIPARFVAMETHQVAGESVVVCESGVMFDADAPYTLGAAQYLSNTAGAHTATVPAISATLTVNQRVGHAISTDTMVFNLQRSRPDILRAQVAYDPASLAAVTSRHDTVALTGLATADRVTQVNQNIAGYTGAGWVASSGIVIQGADVSAADTLRLRLVNATAGAVDGPSITIDVYIERP